MEVKNLQEEGRDWTYLVI